MTINELITILSKCDPNLTIWIESAYDEYSANPIKSIYIDSKAIIISNDPDPSTIIFPVEIVYSSKPK